MVESGEELKIPTTVGVGIAGDAFYAPGEEGAIAPKSMSKAGLVFVEMESDTLFVISSYRGWRSGALFASDGEPGVTKPENKEADFREGEWNSIKVAVHAMWKIAQQDLNK